ncbi:MAG: HAMP domain-containing protein [Acidimicrobiales bacterium]|nr:HAMP domain-containing protein [Acidimicrobiales bacterium]
MRRQLDLAAAAIVSLIVLAFLVPLALMVREVARDRALTAAEENAETLVPVLVTVRDTDDLDQVVTGLNESGTGDITLFLDDGTVLGVPADLDASVALARQGRAFTTDADGGLRLLVPVVTADAVDVISVFVPDDQLQQGVRSAWTLLALLGVALVAVAVVVADRLARSIVRPVRDLADVAERLGQGELDARVSPGGPPEVVEVGLTLNQLAGRIEALLTAEREAVADLSHRLRTPVTALRLDVDSLRDLDERERLATDVDELARAVDRLITEARRPVREGIGAAADLTAVTADRVGFWAALAEDQGRTYDVELPPVPTPVGVAPDDLAALLDALLGNVFAHTPDGTGFRVAVRTEPGGGATLVVDDDGRGFPEDRSVLSRGESGGGSTGLGLDIVRTTAERGGGSVSVESAPSGGARVVVRLGPPAVPRTVR